MTAPLIIFPAVRRNPACPDETLCYTLEGGMLRVLRGPAEGAEHGWRAQVERELVARAASSGDSPSGRDWLGLPGAREMVSPGLADPANAAALKGVDAAAFP